MSSRIPTTWDIVYLAFRDVTKIDAAKAEVHSNLPHYPANRTFSFDTLLLIPESFLCRPLRHVFADKRRRSTTPPLDS